MERRDAPGNDRGAIGVSWNGAGGNPGCCHDLFARNPGLNFYLLMSQGLDQSIHLCPTGFDGSAYGRKSRRLGRSRGAQMTFPAGEFRSSPFSGKSAEARSVKLSILMTLNDVARHQIRGSRSYPSLEEGRAYSFLRRLWIDKAFSSTSLSPSQSTWQLWHERRNSHFSSDCHLSISLP